MSFFAIAGERRASGGSGAQTGQLLEVARRHGARPPRSGWHGLCIRAPTSWLYLAPATLIPSPRTPPSARYASPSRTWPFWAPLA